MRSLPLASLALALALPAAAAEPATVVKLWPGKAPGETKDIGPEQLIEPKPGQSAVKRLTNVSEPSISVYLPPKEKANGAAVVVAPGGGYSILAIEHEGTMVCDWLASQGVVAVLLKYRVPTREMQMPTNLAAIQDGQRALSLTRSRAAEWGIDPNRIGMIGFSAGGNLTAWMCCGAEKKLYDAVDKADEVPFKPNFAILVYPGGLIDKGGELKSEFKVTKETPPMLFVHATNDASENSVALYLACKKAGVPAEMHLYASGGHGFGMNKIPHPAATWPDRAADWMQTRGYLTKK
ncbi:MAG TPA: alpha/beta hydrolase [Gemmataceae bacterium]|nr:alpha/beta hydrolase [Gemmataceae bacterium]